MILEELYKSSPTDWEEIAGGFVYKKDDGLKIMKEVDTKIEIPEEDMVGFVYRITYQNEIIKRVGIGEMSFMGEFELIPIPLVEPFDMELGIVVSEIISGVLERNKGQ